MDSELVAVVGPAGFFARVDPGQPKRIFFDRTAVGAHEMFEVTKPDDRFTIRAVAANVLVNFAPKWECGTDLNRQFETRPVDARGPHEAPVIVRMPSGLIVAFVEHETDDGRRFTSAPLTLVRL
jgi:hypothetical protein